MDELDEDVFSPESEARVCEHVLGDARHGLQVAALDRSDVALGRPWQGVRSDLGRIMGR
jgi:hypothetical protein